MYLISLKKFCSTRKSTQQAGEILAKDSRGKMIRTAQQRQKLMKYANMVKDNKLRGKCLYQKNTYCDLLNKMSVLPDYQGQGLDAQRFYSYRFLKTVFNQTINTEVEQIKKKTF